MRGGCESGLDMRGEEKRVWVKEGTRETDERLWRREKVEGNKYLGL